MTVNIDVWTIKNSYLIHENQAFHLKYSFCCSICCPATLLPGAVKSGGGGFDCAAMPLLVDTNITWECTTLMIKEQYFHETLVSSDQTMQFVIIWHVVY
jgi:hypothetical protein